MGSEPAKSPALRMLLADCTHCGDCLEACPTYVISGVETESPRGRIAVLEHALEHPGLDSGTLVARIDSCTGCLRCVSACPEQVRYETILPLARALADAQRPAEQARDGARRLTLETLTHPWTLKRLTPLVRAARKLRPRRFPEPVRTLTDVLGELPGRDAAGPIPLFTPAVGESRGRVGLLLGCVQRVIHPALHRATIAVLAAQGFEVIAPEQPACCGGLHLQAAESAEAARRAQRTIDAFAAVGGVDRVLTTAGGCGAAMRSYGALLGSARAGAFAGLVSDACAFLAEQPQRSAWAPLALTVAWHESCQHAPPAAAGSADGRPPGRTLLAQVPGLKVIETTEPGLCCGAIGAYPIDQPERAAALGARRAQQLIDAGGDAIVATSPDCADQIVRSAAALGRELVVYHPLELLARAITS